MGYSGVVWQIGVRGSGVRGEIMFQRWSDAGGEVRSILYSVQSHEGGFLKN